MDRSSHGPGQEWRGHQLAQVWPTLESRAHQHATLPPSPPLLASRAPRGGQREPGQQEQKVQAPSPAVPPLRDQAMNSCPFLRMRTCTSSPQFGVCSLHEPHASRHVAAWSWKLGLEETLKNQCITTPFSGGETEAQGGPGPGAISPQHFRLRGLDWGWNFSKFPHLAVHLHSYLSPPAVCPPYSLPVSSSPIAAYC